MELNSFIFPRPDCTWNCNDLHNRLIFIPKIPVRNNIRRTSSFSSAMISVTKKQVDIPLFVTRESILLQKTSKVINKNAGTCQRPTENTNFENFSYENSSWREINGASKIHNYNFNGLLAKKPLIKNLNSASELNLRKSQTHGSPLLKN